MARMEGIFDFGGESSMPARNLLARPLESVFASVPNRFPERGEHCKG
ncbi:hypothetical protein [Amycolatopsis sp. NPDC054798]